MTTKEKIGYWLFCYGCRVGLTFIFSPIAWDILYRGGRDLEHVAIGTKGVITQVLGAILFLGAYLAEKNLSKKTKP